MPTTYPVRIERVVQETPKDRTLVFRVPAGAEDAFRFEPGQYVTFRDTLDGKDVARSYSISSAPDSSVPGSPAPSSAAPTPATGGAGGTFDVTVRDAGAYGSYLYALPVGHVLLAQPPRGSFTLDRTPGRRLLLTAGGSGVTPYRGFLRHLVAHAHRDPVALLHSVRTPDELIFRQEFEQTARAHAWLTYLPSATRADADPSWTGRRGRIDAGLIASLAPHPAQALVYACGPNEFVDAIVELARAAGLAPEQVRREKWG